MSTSASNVGVLESLRFLMKSRASLRSAFIGDLNSGMELLASGFHDYSISPLDFLPLEALGSPHDFRGEAANIKFIEECGFRVGDNATKEDLIELVYALNNFHTYEFFDPNDSLHNISSRGLPNAAGTTTGVKVDGAEPILRYVFLEHMAYGDYEGFFAFVKAFNRIKNLECSTTEWEFVLSELDPFSDENLLERISDALDNAHDSGIKDPFRNIGAEREPFAYFDKEEESNHQAFVSFAVLAEQNVFSNFETLAALIGGEVVVDNGDKEDGENEDFDGEDFDHEEPEYYDDTDYEDYEEDLESYRQSLLDKEAQEAEEEKMRGINEWNDMMEEDLYPGVDEDYDDDRDD